MDEKKQIYLEFLLNTQKALPGKKTDEIPGQAQSPEPPVTPEYPAWYPHNLVAAKIQHSQPGQHRDILHLQLCQVTLGHHQHLHTAGEVGQGGTARQYQVGHWL